jgi:hypothetical protein
MALLQITDDRPWFPANSGKAVGQRFAVTSSRTRARIATREMWPPAVKDGAKSLITSSDGTQRSYEMKCVFSRIRLLAARLSHAFRGDSASEELTMSTLKIGSTYRESSVLIVPSAAGFPLVFKPARPSGHCWLSMTLGLATTVAVFWITTVPCSPAAAARNGYQISAGRAAAIYECSISAGRYSQHDWGNTEIYQYRACMAAHDQRE